MKISVIISAHRDRGWLNECIESAKNQTFKDYEIILSSDGNMALKLFADKHKIRFIYSMKGNHSLALNSAVLFAKGKWIKEIHDDDLLTENCLTDLYDAKDNADFIYGDAIYIEDKKTSVYESPLNIELSSLLPIINNPICSATIFFKRDVFLDVNGFDPKMEYCEDYEFYLNLLTKGYKFIHCPNVVAKYRIHEGSQITRFNETLRQRDRNYIINKYKL
jgi:glycosyltransferase involved in cell wall biosynthesis